MIPTGWNCDQFGLYVIDEANLETHGVWEKPSCNPAGATPLWSARFGWWAATEIILP